MSQSQISNDPSTNVSDPKVREDDDSQELPSEPVDSPDITEEEIHAVTWTTGNGSAWPEQSIGLAQIRQDNGESAWKFVSNIPCSENSALSMDNILGSVSPLAVLAYESKSGATVSHNKAVTAIVKASRIMKHLHPNWHVFVIPDSDRQMMEHNGVFRDCEGERYREGYCDAYRSSLGEMSESNATR